MRILAISECFPCVGRDGGALRLYKLLKALSAEARIDLACFSKFSPGEAMRVDAKGFCEEIRVVGIGRPRIAFNCAMGAMSRTPLNVMAYSTAEMRRAVRSFLENNRYDLVYIYRLRMAPYAEAYEKIPKLLDLTDSLTLYLERRLDVERGVLKKLFLRSELGKMVRCEAEAANQADLVLVSADPDLLRLRAQSPGAAAAAVENGVDCDYFAPGSGIGGEKSARPTLAFHGNMGYRPNSDAAEHFCLNVLPGLQANWPDLELILIGGNAPRRIRALGRRKGVVVTGRAEDVRPLLQRAWLYVAPLRFAAGVQIKLIEAMAMGLPVVASRLCAEALGPGTKSAMVVAQNEAELAASVEALLADPAKREELGCAGRRFVEENFSWDRAGRKLKELCIELVSRRGAAG